MATAKKSAAKTAETKKTSTKAAANAKKCAAPKKTAAATPKSAAPKKSATVTEISVNGNKKIATLQKEFSRKFPYTGIYVFDPSMKPIALVGGPISPFNPELTIAAVRRVNSGGSISINGHKKIGTLEKEFEEVFGLYIQVCCQTVRNQRHYTMPEQDAYTLTAYNKWCEANPEMVEFTYE